MSNKKQQGKGIGQRIRQVIAAILGILVLIGAFILGEITGIDLVGQVLQEQNSANELPAAPPPAPESVTALAVGQGFAYQKDFWTVYFNAPSGSSDRSTYVNGIDVPLTNILNSARSRIDIAAFEFNNPLLTEAVLDAHRRGVTVRLVTDDEHGLEEEDESIPVFIRAGIPVVDDERSALMHNKFMIIDNTYVLTGSWNFTVNGTYRNNNNALLLRSQRAVRAYQEEFEEMFTRREFGPTSTEGVSTFTQNGTPIQILFAAEDAVTPTIVQRLQDANSHLRFMAFSFTQDDIGAAMQEAARRGVTVEGIFEVRGSETEFSELTRLYCAGLDVRQDGNPYTLHHKVIIIDNDTVLTGSFNFSANATESNDENMIIIRDPDLAALYIQEYERRKAEAAPPPAGDIDC